ncbi:LPD1 domain-containing protein [Aureispira sp. CCB-QB1]|uniref:LPD1 domain-containing protein n=1 Tax=Aureispira sp. CCB-QB1 TaxID=1313421 RepID=UPI000695CBE0|nr:LPD1 domain-containing protein [Aureispira sp. CCB-QB1]
MNRKDYKLVSTLDDKSGYSGLDRFWNRQGFQSFYKSFRKGSDLPKYIKDNPVNVLSVQDRYKLRGIQFGNWLSQEDRFNYTAALYICLYDLNKVLKFKDNNIGLDGALGIAFGARGRSKAPAHFEASTDIINMTRYKGDASVPKRIRFVNSGGVGALAHEYGHFLDYYFGAHYEPYSGIYALTNGRSENKSRIDYPKANKMRIIIEDILEQAYWAAPGKTSAYYQRIRKVTKDGYWVRRNEIFARLFEQYISYKLNKIGVNNSFLNDPKYNMLFYYYNQKELKRVVPLFDALVAEMRTHF